MSECDVDGVECKAKCQCGRKTNDCKCECQKGYSGASCKGTYAQQPNGLTRIASTALLDANYAVSI